MKSRKPENKKYDDTYIEQPHMRSQVTTKII